jgi:hypothetical protein
MDYSLPGNNVLKDHSCPMLRDFRSMGNTDLGAAVRHGTPSNAPL